MAQIHAEPEALRKLAQQQRHFAEELEVQQRLLHAVLDRLQNTWSDAQFKRFTDAFLPTLEQLTSCGTQFKALANRLDVLAAPLEAYLGTSTVSSSISSPSLAAALARSGTEATSNLTSKGGFYLTLLPAAMLASAEIDWGTPGFEHRFETERHHGYTGHDYLTLAARLPTVLRHLKTQGNPDALPSGSAERVCYNAFFGDHPIRLERKPTGCLDVIDGRHRLYACLQLGIDPPASIVDKAITRK